MAIYERWEFDFAGMTVLKSCVFVNCLPMFLVGRPKLNKALIFHAGLLLCCWVHFLSCNTAGLKMFTEHCPYCVSYLYVFNVIYRQVSFLVVTQAFQMPVVRRLYPINNVGRKWGLTVAPPVGDNGN